ncbi:hypothetical protein TYRP_015328 [Tyrophagus putrescentiae]|nr:hypothetical protein TYRP_015328 [Tyrophagus putrescentiae]
MCLCLADLVRAQVEGGEEVEVEAGLPEDVHAEEPVVAGLEEAEVEAVGEEEHELDNLQLGDVPLPPEVGLHLGAEGGQAVVGVHDLRK